MYRDGKVGMYMHSTYCVHTTACVYCVYDVVCMHCKGAVGDASRACVLSCVAIVGDGEGEGEGEGEAEAEAEAEQSLLAPMPFGRETVWPCGA